VSWLVSHSDYHQISINHVLHFSGKRKWSSDGGYMVMVVVFDKESSILRDPLDCRKYFRRIIG
jgi:hypothetical protein